VILLFGGNGQLGRELTALAEARGVPLRALSHFEADIADPFAVDAAVAAARPSLVVNAAAYTAVDKAESEPAEAERVNTRGPGFLAHACARKGIPLVHISTDYVFDGTKDGPYVERDPVAPLGVYGRTKAEGEDWVRAWLDWHLILRTSWVYGVHGRNILKTVLKLAQERDELRFVADQRGCPTSTADIAEAILCAAPRLVGSDVNVPGTYHFAGAGAATWYDFVCHVVAVQAEFTARHPRVVPIATADYPTAARRPANSALDSSRFATTFGFRPKPWQARVEEAVRALLRDKAEAA
jgi:dTDP-4-dehydrorhamnose reductase